MTTLSKGQRAAIEIASMPVCAFEARMQSGEFAKWEVSAARALRAQLLSRGLIQKRDEAPTPMSITEKVEKSVQMGAILSDTIRDYARVHNVSLSVACDRVCLSPEVSQSVMLEKRAKDLERAMSSATWTTRSAAV